MNRSSRTLDDPIEVEISEDLTLLAGQSRPREYPTSKIKRGLVISLEGEELCEEGAGFGLPVLKFGDAAAFPGWSRSRVRKMGKIAFVETEYEMNLVSRLAVGGELLERDRLCRAKERIDRLHRDHPSLRRTIEIGSALFRRALSVETRLLEADSFGRSRVRYAISERGEIDVRVRCWPKREGCTEMAVMNEQGAGSFDHYRDSEGLDLSGDEIGCWQRTAADWAQFIDDEHGLSFKLPRIEGAELFYGREMRAGRLAWAGLAHVVPLPGRRDLEYRIELGRSP